MAAYESLLHGQGARWQRERIVLRAGRSAEEVAMGVIGALPRDNLAVKDTKELGIAKRSFRIVVVQGRLLTGRAPSPGVFLCMDLWEGLGNLQRSTFRLSLAPPMTSTTPLHH